MLTKYILVVDDIREFGSTHKDCTFIYCRTSKAAIQWLKDPFYYNKDRIQEVWLDHDLGSSWAGEIDDTRSVVRYIEAMAKNGEYAPKIRILSSNPVGRAYIQSALENCCEILS